MADFDALPAEAFETGYSRTIFLAIPESSG
jgi:hypothetical protein